MQQGIPRALYFMRVLWLCFFPVFTVVAGNAFLLGVPQAREALLAFDGSLSQTLALFVAQLFWVGLAWYTARLLLDKRFDPQLDILGVCCSEGFATNVARWLPRVLSLVGGVFIALFLLFADPAHWRGAVLLIENILFFVWTMKRRDWLRSSSQLTALASKHSRFSHEQFDRVDRLAPFARVIIGVAFVVSGLLWLGVWLVTAPLSRAIGSPALVLFALGSWTLFGGLVLTYLPKARGHMALTWLPALLLIAFAGLNENHQVASDGPGVPSGQVARHSVADDFKTWLKTHGGPDEPVIFVVSGGGAARAAYWSGSALGLIEDESRAPGKTRLSQRVFMISAISGGSLGAASYVAALDAVAKDPQLAKNGVRQLITEFVGKDDLAPVVGAALYTDLIQRFLPFPVASFDRSLALENTWISDWQDVTKTSANPWSEAFTALHARGPDSLPLLALNTTALSRGLRVYQSDFTLDGSDAADLFDPNLKLDTQHLSLAQAVHNSARFPYISPAGMVRSKDGKDQVWDRLGDGGYVESSGARTVLDVIAALRRAGLVLDCSNDRRCNSKTRGTDWVALKQLRVLLLFNAPAEPAQWFCPSGNAGLAPGASSAPKGMWLPDLSAPPLGLADTYGREASTATTALIRAVGGCAQVAEVRLPKDDTQRAPSMNWMLNPRSRRQIDHALDGAPDAHSPAEVLLQQHLQLLRSWLQLRPPLK